MSLASTVAFEKFTELCASISNAQKEKKVEILQSFLSKWRELASSMTIQDGSFYPVMRMLLPHLDRYRGAYGIKENTLAKIYIRILCLPPNGRDAVKLLNFKTPTKAGNQAGDFAEVAYWVLKDRCSKGKELSVEDVNDRLDRIADKHAAHDPRGVDAELCYLLQKMSADEQKWFIRIILKDMKSQLGQSKVLNAFHADAKELFEVCSSLQRVCEKLHNTNVRLHEIDIELFSPFRPMLSEECDLRKVDLYLIRSPMMYIETKLDGERFQVHMNQGNYKFFSRNGYDYTAVFGDSRLSGLLTPHLASQLSSDIVSVILDGEMMCWNPRSKKFTTKGMNIDVKTLKETSLHQPCFCAFDILHLNGIVLTNKPLVERIAILEKAVKPLEGHIILVKRESASKKEEIFEALNLAIDNCEEGVILKESLAVYKPNVRQGGGWFKLKPEYSDGLMDTMDVLIVGGYHGGGRHHGRISHFLVAVSTDSPDGQRYLTMARVGSGYSMEELDELQNKLQSFWKTSCPDTVECTKEKPDMWIEPAESIILEVKASEIVPSDSYKTGFTLRFPRTLKVRYDKSYTDCLTAKEFEKKRLNASGKLTTRHLIDDDTSPQKKRRVVGERSKIALASQFQATDITNVEVKSDLLKDKEICVMTGWEDMSKSDIERYLASYGAILTQNPGMGTWCILAEEETVQRVHNAIKSNCFNVAKCSWLLPLLDNANLSEIPDFPPHSLLGMSASTSARLEKMYDKYGDIFNEESTLEDLKKCLLTASKMKTAIDLDDEHFLEVELFGFYRMFKRCVAYLASGKESFTARLILYEFRYYGGLVVDDIDSSVTHVFLPAGDATKLDEMREIRRGYQTKFHLLSLNWVIDCMKSKCLVKKDEYRL